MSETVAVVRASRPNFLVLAPLCAGLGVAVAWHQGDGNLFLHQGGHPPMARTCLRDKQGGLLIMYSGVSQTAKSTTTSTAQPA